MAKIHVPSISFLLFFLLSLNLISCSKSEGNETISSYPPESSIASAPESDKASNLSPEYTKESTPEEPEQYHLLSSPSPVAETDDYEVFLSKAPVPPETNSSQPEADDFYNPDQVKAMEPAPSKDVISRESEKSSSPEPKVEPEANHDDHISPIKAASVPAPSIAIPLSETNTESSQVAPDGEVVGVSLTPESSILPYKAEDAHQTASFESDINNYYNSTTENQDSPTLHEDGNSTVETPESTRTSEEDTQSTQVSPPVDEQVSMQSLSSNPPVMLYTAEEETVDFVHEDHNQGIWAGQVIDGDQVAGIMVGVCLVCLAGLVYNSRKKKKTQFQYQPLSKKF